MKQNTIFFLILMMLNTIIYSADNAGLYHIETRKNVHLLSLESKKPSIKDFCFLGDLIEADIDIMDSIQNNILFNNNDEEYDSHYFDITNEDEIIIVIEYYSLKENLEKSFIMRQCKNLNEK